jgi:hypothetical protein
LASERRFRSSTRYLWPARLTSHKRPCPSTPQSVVDHLHAVFDPAAGVDWQYVPTPGDDIAAYEPALM